MIDRSQIVMAARTWKGTPFVHQGRERGTACDCAGLLIRVAMDLGLPMTDFIRYGRSPHPKRMGELIRERMDPIPISDAGPGDAVWIAWRDHPQHLGILSDIGLIHAYADAGQVVEHPLDQTWIGRIRAAFRFRT